MKYRAWNKKNKRFVYFALRQNRFTSDIENYSSDGFDCEPWEEYTGLTDRNGKEIYEGERIRLYNRINSEVYWEFGSWQLREGEKAGGLLGSHDEENIEVIGNVFENPELTHGGPEAPISE